MQRFSQLGQEEWVLQVLNGKRGGYFVDIGAGDGELLSNSLVLERDFGWTGVAVEPSRQFEMLKARRRCQCVQACLSDRVEEVEFVEDYKHGEHNHFSGIRKYIDNYAIEGKSVRMQTTTLESVLAHVGAPAHMDYLSIDTEGSELVILRVFPFSKYQFSCITVEHNFVEPKRTQIMQLLQQHGYQRVYEVQWDDWYVHQSMLPK